MDGTIGRSRPLCHRCTVRFLSVASSQRDSAAFVMPQNQERALTSDLSDAVEGVFQGVQGAGVAFALALRGHAQLQLLDGLHQLFLGLDSCRLVAAAARGGGGVVLRAGGQQAVRQGAAGGRETLGVGAGHSRVVYSELPVADYVADWTAALKCANV